MLCPLCQETLQMMDRNGIEIDYCPKCRGVWLDRGELQKLIELSVAQATTPPVVPEPPRRPDPPVPQIDWEQSRRYEENRYPERRHDGYYGHNGHGKYKKRESWLGELFDWD